MEANAGTKPVAERTRSTSPRCEPVSTARLPGFAGPLEVRQFKGGQSNPTYQLVTPARPT